MTTETGSKWLEILKWLDEVNRAHPPYGAVTFERLRETFPSQEADAIEADLRALEAQGLVRVDWQGEPPLAGITAEGMKFAHGGYTGDRPPTALDL